MMNFVTFVKPTAVKRKSLEITGITEEMLKDAPDISEVLPELEKFIDGSIIVAHNADFDVGFCRTHSEELEKNLRRRILIHYDYRMRS